MISERVVRAAVLCALVSAIVGLPQRSQRGGDARPSTQWLCQRPECQCDDQDGLELIQCDCSRAEQQEPLLLGDSTAFVSDRSLRLHVRNCQHVTVVSQALSRAVSLQQLQLTNISRLRLQPLSMYTDGDVQRSVHLRNVANLTVDGAAFDRVVEMDVLELEAVRSARLPADMFGPDADLLAFSLVDSRISQLDGLRLKRADNVTVRRCAIGRLSVDVGRAGAVVLEANTIERVDRLRVNADRRAHSKDARRVTLSGNTIASLDTDQLQMTVDTFQLLNNTIGRLTAPLRVSFKQAHVFGNDIAVLGDAAFAALRQLPGVDIRLGDASVARPFEPAVFTFAGNRLAAAENGTFGLFLQPDDDDAVHALFHVYGNRFGCNCPALAELVRVGERAFLAAAGNDTGARDDPVVSAQEVERELYATSVCEDGRPLHQFRLTALADDYSCLPERAADKGGLSSGDSQTVSLLTLLVTAASVMVTATR